MRSLTTIFIAFALSLIFALPTFSQEQVPYVSSMNPMKITELEQWLKEYKAWKKWHTTQFNRFQHYGKRKEKPVEPKWLEAECQQILEYDVSLLSIACLVLKEDRGDPNVRYIREQIEMRREEREKIEKTSFWEMLHIDGGWVRTTFRKDDYRKENNGIYGIFGVHMGIPLPGYERFQISIPPGVMVFSIPNSEGKRSYYPAAFMGASFRLFDVSWQGATLRVHVTIARAWFFRNIGPKVGIDVGGLSVTLKDPK